MLDELTRARRRETADRLTALLDLVAQGLIAADDVLSDSSSVNGSLTRAHDRSPVSPAVSTSQAAGLDLD